MPSWRSALLLAAWAAFTACSTEVPYVLVLVNDIGQVRTDEPIVVSRAELESRMGAIPFGFVPHAVYNDGTAVPGQVDDVDGDGEWDDWALLLSVGAGDEIRLRVSVLDSTHVPRFKARTNVRVEGSRGAQRGGKTAPGVPQAVAWENDVVGFRLVLGRFAGRQVLGKITMEMVLDSIVGPGMAEGMTLWGKEIVDERTSLGAGALAVWTNGRLERPVASAATRFRLLAQGPARSVFEVHFPNWIVGETTCDLTERITIWAGRPGYESTVTVRGLHRELVAGIARPREGTMYQWKWDTPFRALAAHGHFGPTDEVSGLAILYPTDPNDDGGEGSTWSGGKTDDSYYVRLPVDDGTPSTHYLYAVWDQQNYRWGDRSNFEGLLRDEARRLASPIRLR